MKNKRTTYITIRLSEEEKAQVEEIASDCGMSTSAFIRIAIKRLIEDFINGNFIEDDYIV